MARPKKAKKNREPESIAHTLDEIESRGDRLTNWVLENPTIVLSVAFALLALSGVYGLFRSHQESVRVEATAELGQVQSSFRKAMGGTTDSVDVPEPANPETAKQVREQYATRFHEIATAHPGTGAGALADLEAGTLQEELGQPEEAIETWRAAVAELGPNHPMTALLELRIAGAREEQSKWIEAGEAYERAADVKSFPLRLTARADAARCYAEAGEVDRALAAYEQVKSEDPDLFLPEHLSSKLLELQAARRLN